MKFIKKIAISIVAALIAFVLTLSGNMGATYVVAGTVALAVLLFSMAVVSLDVIFSDLNSERLLLISAGVTLGLFAGHIILTALQTAGLSFIGMNILSYLFPAIFVGFVGYAFAERPGLQIFGGGGAYRSDKQEGGNHAKILDTSVIIDGRILDIAETNFLEGPFIIPNFVLREIQLISDSPDPVKRNRGRRGLEMLNKLQQHGSVKVKISYIDYSDIREVDAKLVRLARETGARLITNDFNLNKVAELQGVLVLNLNNLTNSLKPIVLPGEEILIDVIKEGKDENQGIGYLEDGTMVVVENGRSLLSKTVRVNVTSIIQTAAGKMIFTRAAGVVEDTPLEERISSGDAGKSKEGRDRGGRGNRNGNRGNAYDEYRDGVPGQNQGRGRRR